MIPKRDQRQMEPWQRIGTYAAGLALEAAGIRGDAELLGRTHMLVAAGGGERDYEVDAAILAGMPKAADPAAYLNEHLMSDLRPTLFLAQLSNLLAGNISIVHGVVGSSRTLMGEEAAGADAARIACARIAAGQGDLFLVGGSYNAQRLDILLQYEMGGALWKQPFTGVWSRRADGGGMVMGSLGCFLVLESRAHAELRGDLGAGAGQQPAPALPGGHDVERPDAVPRVLRRRLAQDQHARRLDAGDGERVAGGHRAVSLGHDDDPVPGGEVLPLVADLVGGVDVQAHEVLCPVVAVHAAAALADLHEPGPHPLGRRVDRHPEGRVLGRAGHQLVAGQRRVDLVGGRAPVASRVHRLQPERGRGREDERTQHGGHLPEDVGTAVVDAGRRHTSDARSATPSAGPTKGQRFRDQRPLRAHGRRPRRRRSWPRPARVPRAASAGP